MRCSRFTWIAPPSPGSRKLLATALALALMAVAAPLRASEGEHALGAGLGYATLVAGPDSGSDLHGVSVQGSYRYGLTDFFTLTTDVNYAFLPRRGAWEHLGFARVGVTYTLDAVAWVPWLGVGAGVYGVSALEPAVDGGLSVGAGVDYRRQRTHSLGLAVWYHALLGHLDEIPATITVGFRLSWYLE